jgi:hypothetical protein
MKENKLSTLFTWFLLVGAFLLPVFFFPYLINPFYNSKLALSFLLAFASIFAFIIQSLQNKKWQFIKTPFTLPLLIFTILVIASSLISHQYPNGQFLGVGGIYLSFATIVLIAPSILSRNNLNKKFSLVVNIATILLSILSILQFFGIGLASFVNKISIWELSNDMSFTLTGFAFVTIQLLSVVLLSNVFDQKSWRGSIFNKIVTVLAAIALGINIWAVLPGGQAHFQNLSLTASASIAKDSLILTKNAIFGYGPDSYSNAFNILKPVWINGLDIWQNTFDSAFNIPLTLVVSLGAIGLLAYLIFVWKTFTTVNKDDEQNVFLKVFIISALIWQFFSPVNLVMFILLAIALAFFTNSNRNQYKKINFNVYHYADLENNSELNSDQAKLAKIKNYFLIGGNTILFLVFAMALYIGGKSFVAYHLLYQSNVNIKDNNIVKAYDNYNQAKNFAPKLDFVRRNNALINLNIAIAMSNKTDATTAEQEQVLQLVNQSITEAKAASILSPLNYQNWYSLSQIYMQLLGTTDQAQQEAFNALAKAITYNPSSPELRLTMGQLFMSNKDYVNASTFFAQAVERKADLPASHYYLAQALIANEQWAEAQASLNNTLALLEKDSENYIAVEKDLNLVNAKIDATKSSDAVIPEQIQQASDSAESSLSLPKISTESGLSNLLNQQDTEAAIQDGALTPDQNLVEN